MARDRAFANRRAVADGRDPLTHKRRSKTPTFREASDAPWRRTGRAGGTPRRRTTGSPLWRSTCTPSSAIGASTGIGREDVLRVGSAAAPGVSVMSPADCVARISAALRTRSAIINDRACPEVMTSKRFRHSAGFGKRIEYWIVGRMLKEGMDVYLPLVDDHAVDAIVKRPDGTVAEIQIKARSRDVIEGDAALFAAIPHPEEREDYWFVFYSGTNGRFVDHDVHRVL